MQKIGFNEALDAILETHPGYDREAYLFLRDALEFSVEKLKKSKGEGSRHVNASQLLDGVREHALQQFGPMVPTVFEFWGVRSCEDIGHMVYHLIEVGIFGKTQEDTLDDFRQGYDFHAAFVQPFLSSEEVPAPSPTA